jgi:hypothetical protein
MAAPGRKPRAWARLAWFTGLYVVSLVIFTLAVYGLRALVSR